MGTMAAKRKVHDEGALLEKYGNFSKKLTRHHHVENLSEFLLHDICDTDLFGLTKAAYLVNNPDFACLKGIVGYHYPESFQLGESWLNPKDFTDHMKNSKFNNQVRAMQIPAFSLKSYDYKDKIFKMAEELNMNQPLYHVWDLKHENQGIFLFEEGFDQRSHRDHLEKFLYMLSFCPIF